MLCLLIQELPSQQKGAPDMFTVGEGGGGKYFSVTFTVYSQLKGFISLFILYLYLLNSVLIIIIEANDADRH